MLVLHSGTPGEHFRTEMVSEAHNLATVSGPQWAARVTSHLAKNGSGSNEPGPHVQQRLALSGLSCHAYLVQRPPHIRTDVSEPAMH